jgi:indolepyruvate ferredoxin oxidoreductase alpha subunit
MMSRKILLSANEAVAWAAAKAGCAVASAYPGTPSTEILENVAKFKDTVYCEWAVNEKVGMEVAIGASIAGARALTAMKHVGLNVAMDPLMTYTYVGANGGLVVVVCDDPGMHSSQNEQDSRNLVRFARAPLFEPADSQEAFDMVQTAFEVSEEFRVPVFVRLNTRTSHTSTVVDVGADFAPSRAGRKPYAKDIRRYIPVPMFARPQRVQAQARTEALRAFACGSPFNRVEEGDAKIGIVTSGVTYQYVKEVFPEFAVLKLGLSNPLPHDLIRAFAAKVESVLVIEELDPVLEEQIRALGIRVLGHATDLNMLEMNPMRLMVLRKEIWGDVSPPDARRADEGLPTRPPVLCAGCPHRGFFYTLAKNNKDGRFVVAGDIGCYTLGCAPPLSSIETCVCMGGGFSVAAGMARVFEREGDERLVFGVMGDSTYMHSGLTGAMEISYNRAKVVPCVLDNSITAMTGHQDNPATGRTLMGEERPAISIEGTLKALGFEKVLTADPQDLLEMPAVLDEAVSLVSAGVSAAIVTKRPCVLIKGLKLEKGLCVVDAEACTGCRLCTRVGCPAIVVQGKKAWIDGSLCTGCTVCAQVCPTGAIGAAEVGK